MFFFVIEHQQHLASFYIYWFLKLNFDELDSDKDPYLDQDPLTEKFLYPDQQKCNSDLDP